MRDLGRKALLLLALVAAALALRTAPTRAQAVPVPGYTVMATGWNLVSAADATALNVPSSQHALFTLQPGDGAYQHTTWQSLKVGAGYWALFDENTAVRLPPSKSTSYSIDVPAGQWVMVGNPASSGSARITGADLSYIYSPLSGYRADVLIPVGYGAFVESDRGGRVTVALDHADHTEVDLDQCCTVGTGNYGGKARIDILDDSPYALLYGVRSIADDGSFPAAVAGNYAYGAVQPCATCAEYVTPPAACRSSAGTRTVAVNPGQYLIRLTTDAARVPDIILVATLKADTNYYFCRWVGANRP